MDQKTCLGALLGLVTSGILMGIGTILLNAVGGVAPCHPLIIPENPDGLGI